MMPGFEPQKYSMLSVNQIKRRMRAKAGALFERLTPLFGTMNRLLRFSVGGDKNKVLTVASNAGHCLLSGIVPPERAKKVKERLMAADMWTGWGIRTLSVSNPAFNPYNYQTGSVWPHDNAIIALGFKRYGFDAEASQIAHDISKAASYFQLNQLPELYTAFLRDETTFPVQYRAYSYHRAYFDPRIYPKDGRLEISSKGFDLVADGLRVRWYARPICVNDRRSPRRRSEKLCAALKANKELAVEEVSARSANEARVVALVDVERESSISVDEGFAINPFP